MMNDEFKQIDIQAGELLGYKYHIDKLDYEWFISKIGIPMRRNDFRPTYLIEDAFMLLDWASHNDFLWQIDTWINNKYTVTIKDIKLPITVDSYTYHTGKDLPFLITTSIIEAANKRKLITEE